MNCIKCGALLEEGDVFCKNCGTPVQNNNSNAFSYEKNNEQTQTESNYMPEQPQQNQQQNYNIQQQSQQNYNTQQQSQQNYNMQQSSQPSYTQMNQNGQKYKNSNDNAGLKIAVIAIISIAIIGALSFIGYSVLKALNNNNDVDTIEENNNNKNISQTIDKSSTYKVYYQGFTYYIPDNLIYSMGEELYIGDEEQTWVASLYSGQGSFQQIKQNKNNIANNLVRQLANSGITAEATNAKVETIDNVEYVTVEVSAGGENSLIAYTQLNSMYFLCISLNNEDNDINKDLLKNLSSIINTAEYDSDSYYLKNDSQVDASKLINVVNE